MAKCPHCQNRLTLRSLMGGGGVVCPYCYSELEARYWNQFFILAVAFLVLFGVRRLLRSAGIGEAWTWVCSLCVYVFVAVLLTMTFARFRLKKPLESSLRG